MLQKQALVTALDRLCIECCVKFGYWVIDDMEKLTLATLSEAHRAGHNIADPNYKHPVDFSAAKAQALREEMIVRATSGELEFRKSILNVIWSMPDRLPYDYRDQYWAYLLSRTSAIDTLCKGKHMHGRIRGIKIGLGNHEIGTIDLAAELNSRKKV